MALCPEYEVLMKYAFERLNRYPVQEVKTACKY
jgi:hypothetical protein